MTLDDKDAVTIADVTVEHETDKALLVVIDNGKMWIPKSVICDESEVYELGTEGFLVVKRWFAEKEELD